MITHNFNFRDKSFGLFSSNQLILYIDKYLYSDRYTLIDYNTSREIQFYPENFRYRILSY